MIVDGVLMMHGPIGSMWYDDISSARVVDAIAGGEGPLAIDINSPGGDVAEGVAIYNALVKASQNGRPLNIEISGLAASAASVVACAANADRGDTLRMRAGSVFMVHNPWTVTAGDEREHARAIAVLDVFKRGILDIYEARSGLDRDTLAGMLDEETWMTAAEAAELGFADAVSDDAAASLPAFAYSKVYANAPDYLPAARSIPMVRSAGHIIRCSGAPVKLRAKNVKPKGSEMPQPADTGEPVKEAKKSEGWFDVAPVAGMSAAEQARFRAKAEAAAAPLAFVNAVLADERVTLADALEKLTDHVAASADRKPHGSAAVVVSDSRERIIAGATAGQAARLGIKGGERNEFSGLGLQALVRAIAGANGVDVGHQVTWATVRKIQAAAASQTVSDFDQLMSNIAQKAMMTGFEAAPVTWDQWCSTGVLVDYKPAKRAALESVPAFAHVMEAEEYGVGSATDRGENIQAKKYGARLRLSEETLRNDDLGAFAGAARMFGANGARTINQTVYALLNSNPTLSDGVALFHASHGNLGTTGVISATTLGEARQLMLEQMAGDHFLNLRPNVLLVSPKNLTLANRWMASEFLITGENATAPERNDFAGLARVVVDAELGALDSGDPWYLAADPLQAPTFEVAFLDGVSEPTVEEYPEWKTDTVDYKARVVFGVAALDYRGLVKNLGA